MQTVFHLQQLLAFALHHLGYRDAGCTRHHFGDFLDADPGAQQPVLLRTVLGLVRGLQLRFKLRQLAVLQLGHLVELAFALQTGHLGLEPVDFLLEVRATLNLRLFGFPDLFQVVVLALQPEQFFLDQVHALLRCLVLLLAHRFALDLELDHAPVEFVHDFRLGIDFHADARRRLVDQVDGLVRQEAVGDVAMAQLGGGNDGRVGDAHPVVQLVSLLQSAQDGDRALDRRLVDQHFLEAAFERGVLLDVFAVLVERRGADAVQFAARQCRLEHVAGVDGAFGFAGANHGVQLVDEDDDLAFILRDFLEHGLQAFLEFAAVLGTGKQRRHVEAQYLLALERFRHFVIDDALRQSFDDGRLADARFADQHRIVLGAPLQDLDGAADFVVATDHRVELALTGAFGEVDAVFFQRLALPFGLLVLYALAAAHGGDSKFERFARKPVLPGQAAGFTLVVADDEQEHLAGDELVTALLRFLVGEIEQVGQIATDLHLAVVAFDFRQALDRLIERGRERLHIGSRLGQQRRGRAVVLPEQGEQQVLRFDHRVVVADRQALGVGQGLLEFGCQFVESHGCSLDGWFPDTDQIGETVNYSSAANPNIAFIQPSMAKTVEILRRSFAPPSSASNTFRKTLIKRIPFMVRQAHHERNQHLTVRPEPVEGLNQHFLRRCGKRMRRIFIRTP